MSKIKSVSYLGEFDTYDLEVDHPDHQYYLANGILTSNSHSISYSHISFYTAWLRCHYPTQFMCALLNSEDSLDINKAIFIVEKGDWVISGISHDDTDTKEIMYCIKNPNKIPSGF